MPLADIEAEAALNSFEKSLMAATQAKEAKKTEEAAARLALIEKPSAATLARGGSGLTAAG